MKSIQMHHIIASFRRFSQPKQSNLISALSIFLSIFLSACDGFNESLSDLQNYEQKSAILMKASDEKIKQFPVSTKPTYLKVLAWNIKYGAKRLPFWFDCWGDRVSMSNDEIRHHMQDLYQLIYEIDPDIVMLEEIEVNSRRSSYYNMVQGFLDQTPLHYGAYFETWDSRYIPSEGLGRMNLGNAILSKYPIIDAKAIRQEDRTDTDVTEDIFYIKRAIGEATILIDQVELKTFVVHTEAYDVDGTKFKQIQQIKTYLDDLSKAQKPWIIGGDFNELPPYANLENHLKGYDAKASEDQNMKSTLEVEGGFLDERNTAVCSDDFKQPPYTPLVMKPFFKDFSAWLPLDTLDYENQSEIQRYFSHSVLGPDEYNDDDPPIKGNWNRTLDYLFASSQMKWLHGNVLQRKGDSYLKNDVDSVQLKVNPIELSDHAPVMGILEWNP